MAETPGAPAGPEPSEDNLQPAPESPAPTPEPSVSAEAPQAPSGPPSAPEPAPPDTPRSEPAPGGPPADQPAKPPGDRPRRPPGDQPRKPQADRPGKPQAPAASPPPQAAAPAPEPAPAENEAPAQPAGIAASVRVPPSDGEESGPSTEGSEGGEWHLLVSRVREWIENAQLRRQWDRLRGPLRALALLIGLILALRIYGSVVDTIDAIPLISGLLELVGLITVVRFSSTRLVLAEERQRVLGEWSRAWQQFRGRL